MSCKIISSAGSADVRQFDWGAQPSSSAGFPVQTAMRPHGPGELHPAVELLLDQARQQGFREGVNQAETAAAARQQEFVNDVSARLAAMVAELAALRPQLRRQAESQVVELALQVARKILNRTISIDPEAITGLVHAALARIDGREILEIRVSPAHHDAVKAAVGRLGLPAQVQIHSDASLEPGAVLVETNRGRLDASVSTQLAEIERGFADYASAGSPA